MSGKVKWFTSSNINAPTLDNNWGALVNVLSKCLIDGYGAQTLLNIVIENGVAIASFGTAHKFEMFQWVEISGSSNSVLNDEFRILGATSTTIEFLIDLPDQTVTETLSCRLAPLGWSKPFSDTGRAVFQAKNTDTNPYFLRVDDTCDPLHTPTRAKFAKVGILESCTGIDDISGNQAPFDPALPTKNWIGTGTAGSTSAIIGWAKWVYATSDNANSSLIALSSVARAGDRGWVLVGDNDNFFILPTTVPESSIEQYKGYSVSYGFGIFKNKDCPFLSARYDYSTLSTQDYSGGSCTFGASTSSFLILLKNRNGSYVTGSSVPTNDTRIKFGLDTSDYTGYSNTFSASAEDGVYHCNFQGRDANNNYLGVIPLLRVCLNSTPLISPSTQIFSENGRAYIRQKHMGASLRAGSIIIDLGEI